MAEQQHRATPQQWLELLELLNRVEALEAKEEGNNEAWAAMRRPGRSQAERIASLVKRIEALENAQPAKSNHPAKPDSSLVKRVAFAITGDSDELINWKPEARAAIREVAGWMRENPDVHFPPALVFALEQQAER